MSPAAKRALALGAGLALLGCTAPPEPAGRIDPEPGAAEAPPPDGQSFGAALDESVPLTPLSAIVASPERYRDQVVRTRGEIARVCQRMGCWMELREGEDGPGVRVPMAGHGFFLPRDSAGRSATTQGRVTLRELSADERAHLESEGAVATASALSIEASGVVID